MVSDAPMRDDGGDAPPLARLRLRPGHAGRAGRRRHRHGRGRTARRTGVGACAGDPDLRPGGAGPGTRGPGDPLAPAARAGRLDPPGGRPLGLGRHGRRRARHALAVPPPELDRGSLGLGGRRGVGRPLPVAPGAGLHVSRRAAAVAPLAAGGGVRLDRVDRASSCSWPRPTSSTPTTTPGRTARCRSRGAATSSCTPSGRAGSASSPRCSSAPPRCAPATGRATPSCAARCCGWPTACCSCRCGSAAGRSWRWSCRGRRARRRRARGDPDLAGGGGVDRRDPARPVRDRPDHQPHARLRGAHRAARRGPTPSSRSALGVVVGRGSALAAAARDARGGGRVPAAARPHAARRRPPLRPRPLRRRAPDARLPRPTCGAGAPSPSRSARCSPWRWATRRSSSSSGSPRRGSTPTRDGRPARRRCRTTAARARRSAAATRELGVVAARPRAGPSGRTCCERRSTPPAVAVELARLRVELRLPARRGRVLARAHRAGRLRGAAPDRARPARRRPAAAGRRWASCCAGCSARCRAAPACSAGARRRGRRGRRGHRRPARARRAACARRGSTRASRRRCASSPRGAAVPVEVQADRERFAARPSRRPRTSSPARRLTNAVKHARADAGHRQRARDDGTPAPVVADDGVGGAAPARAGRGSPGIADRVAAHGGTLRIDSPHGAGTHVDGGAAMRVVIAEDQVLLREGLARLFEDAGHEVVAARRRCRRPARASSASTARPRRGRRAHAARRTPTRAPRGAAEIRGAHPTVGGARALPAHRDAALVELVVAGAASATCSRTGCSTCGEFLDAAERVAGGGSALDPQVVAPLLARRARGRPLAGLRRASARCSRSMAEGLTNAGIAKRLCSPRSTVESHVRNVLMKLDVPGSATATAACSPCWPTCGSLRASAQNGPRRVRCWPRCGRGLRFVAWFA